VDYVVEGSVRREGMRVRIAAQLIRTSDQSPRWSMNFDRSIRDAISLETEVASAIANDIETTLGNHTPLQAVPMHQMMPDAYDAYLRGMSESGIRSEEEFKRVVGAFQKSLGKDPNCAMYWAGLAYAYDQAGNSGILAPQEAFTKTREAALKAIKNDPTHPDAHVYLADALLTNDFDWSGAEREIQRALTLNPNDAVAHQWYGFFLFLRGDPDEGFMEMNRALTLDPLSTDRMVFLGGSALAAGRLEVAKKYLKMAIDIDPDLAVAHTYLGYVYDLQGNQDQAVSELTEAFRLRGETQAETTLRETYATAGYEVAKKASILQDIAFWTNVGKQRYVSAFMMAADYAILGDKEQAIAWLQRAYQERDVRLLCLRSEQNLWFSSVKNDPRFQAIVAKLGYPH